MAELNGRAKGSDGADDKGAPQSLKMARANVDHLSRGGSFPLKGSEECLCSAPVLSSAQASEAGKPVHCVCSLSSSQQ